MNHRVRALPPEAAARSARAAQPSRPLPMSLQAMRSTDLLQLQATAGNRAARGAMQRQMEVGAAGDAHEVEADAVAREIVNGGAQQQELQREAEEEELQAKHIAREALEDEELQAKHIARAELEEEELQAKHIAREAVEDEELQAKHVSREALEEEELQAKHVSREALEEEEMQAKHLQRATPEVGMEGGTASDQTSAAVEGARGGGRPLGEGVRREMEGAFGADFSAVRVHEGAESADLNDRLSARAFTTGSDIFIGREGLNPGSRGGKELLAHELTHVVQQGAAGRKPRRS